MNRADPRAEADGAFQLRDSNRQLRRAHRAGRGFTRAPAGRIFSIRDVTAERQSEEAKGQFVATVSHELRTPLTSIVRLHRALAGSRARRVLPGEQRRLHLEDVRHNASRLQRLVGDLLFFEQVQSNKLVLDVARRTSREIHGRA